MRLLQLMAITAEVNHLYRLVSSNKQLINCLPVLGFYGWPRGLDDHMKANSLALLCNLRHRRLPERQNNRNSCYRCPPSFCTNKGIGCVLSYAAVIVESLQC